MGPVDVGPILAEADRRNNAIDGVVHRLTGGASWVFHIVHRFGTISVRWGQSGGKNGIHARSRYFVDTQRGASLYLCGSAPVRKGGRTEEQ